MKSLNDPEMTMNCEPLSPKLEGIVPVSLLRSIVKPINGLLASEAGKVPVSWLLSIYSNLAPILPSVDGIVPFKEFPLSNKFVSDRFPIDGGIFPRTLQKSN